jgi:hypothetical protein
MLAVQGQGTLYIVVDALGDDGESPNSSGPDDRSPSTTGAGTHDSEGADRVEPPTYTFLPILEVFLSL